MKVIGLQHYKFTTKDGDRLEGNKLHIVLDTPEINMIGKEARLVSVSDAILNECLKGMPADKLVGENIEVIYNRYGKPARINIVK